MNGRRKSTATSAAPAKDKTCLQIEKREADREERRRAMVEAKKARAEEEQRNIAAGNPGDVDFIGMVRQWRNDHASDAIPHDANNNNNNAQQQQKRISICVRKRPISDKERERNDHDSITCLNPTVWVHSAKFKVDGITKFLSHTTFSFDHAFDETVPNDEVYRHTTMPLLDFCVSGVGGRATVFAFGQTGSGKTHTMQGIQDLLVEDLFLLLSDVDDSGGGRSLDNTAVLVSFFEMYDGSIQDLLNNRQRLRVLEDGTGEVNVTGLVELEATNEEQLFQILRDGNMERTTHVTEANDTSSRSHAICQIMLRDRKNDRLVGKLSLVDLAGSERGADTKSHNAQRRNESSDINTSLLALKECIRALDHSSTTTSNNKGDTTKHIPYRNSKLTMVLKDCFTSDSAMTTMIATISPGASAADHSINTLRYADLSKNKSRSSKSPKRGLAQSPIRRTVLSSSTGAKSPTRMVQSPIRRTVVGPGTAVVSAKSAGTTTGSSSSGNALYPTSVEFNDTRMESTMMQRQQTRAQQQDSVTAQLQQEEAILQTHMENIQTTVELLTLEGEMVSKMQVPGNRTPAEVDKYVTSLEDILNQKEGMIRNLRRRMDSLKESM